MHKLKFLFCISIQPKPSYRILGPVPQMISRLLVVRFDNNHGTERESRSQHCCWSAALAVLGAWQWTTNMLTRATPEHNQSITTNKETLQGVQKRHTKVHRNTAVQNKVHSPISVSIVHNTISHSTEPLEWLDVVCPCIDLILVQSEGFCIFMNWGCIFTSSFPLEMIGCSCSKNCKKLSTPFSFYIVQKS